MHDFFAEIERGSSEHRSCSSKVFREIEDTSFPYLPQGGANNWEQLGKTSNRKGED